MFHDEFYPTPPDVIDRMVQPWRIHPDRPALKLAGLTILEPSAGSGAMLTHLIHHSLVSPPARLHAVEPNPACRTLLQAIPQVSLVGDDFLQFAPSQQYDLILMNPPFSQGTRHLLHAWDISTTAHIACLLNAETVRNPFSAARKRVQQLIEEHGSVEFLGPVFAEADRPTDVDVALVRLRKVDQRDRFHFWNDHHWQQERPPIDYTEETLGNEVATNDLVAALVGQYRHVEHVFVDYLKAHRRLQHHVRTISTHSHRSFDDMLKDAIRFRDTPQEMVQHFMADLRQQAWQSVIARTRVSDLMTGSVRRDFDELQQSQQAMDFTEANIHALFELLFTNRSTILQRSVEESFDLMTRYHKENRVHQEGWLSNDAFKVTKKVVLPGCVQQGYVSGMQVSHYHQNTLNDIDRGVAMVDGRKLGDITTIVAALDDRFKGMKVYSGPLEDNTCTSTYFHIRFFKKGTIHLTWLDEGLRERFNLAAARCKKWLPMDHGRKADENRNSPAPTSNPHQLLLTS